MAYLTSQEYLDRFGDAETIRLTDEARTGAVDTGKLEAAIEVAEEEINAYIGERYTVPLVAAPKLIKSMTGTLARDELHKTRPSEAVTSAADRVRAQLRDLSRGLMTLPTDAGALAEDGRPAADSAASGDGVSAIFTEDSLSGFGIASGYPGSNWRA